MIRVADPTDADAVSVLHVRSWRTGFREFIDAGLLPEADLAQRRAFWSHVLARPSDEVTILVAADAGGPIGVCLIVAANTDDDIPDPGVAQIMVLYVDPVAWRTGAGRALLNEGRRLVRERGQHSWVLWTLADHIATRAFYDAEGFRPDGAERTEGKDGARVVRLRQSTLASGEAGVAEPEAH